MRLAIRCNIAILRPLTNHTLRHRLALLLPLYSYKKLFTKVLLTTPSPLLWTLLGSVIGEADGGRTEVKKDK